MAARLRTNSASTARVVAFQGPGGGKRRTGGGGGGASERLGRRLLALSASHALVRSGSSGSRRVGNGRGPPAGFGDPWAVAAEAVRRGVADCPALHGAVEVRNARPARPDDVLLAAPAAAPFFRPDDDHRVSAARRRALVAAGAALEAVDAVLEDGFKCAASLLAGPPNARAMTPGDALLDDASLAAVAGALRAYSGQVLLVDTEAFPAPAAAPVPSLPSCVRRLCLRAEGHAERGEGVLVLRAGCREDEYVDLFAERLRALIKACPEPQLVVYRAGVDGLLADDDRDSSFAFTREALLRRSHLVLSACLPRRIPLVLIGSAGRLTPARKGARAAAEARVDVFRAAACRLRADPGRGRNTG